MCGVCVCVVCVCMCVCEGGTAGIRACVCAVCRGARSGDGKFLKMTFRLCAVLLNQSPHVAVQPSQAAHDKPSHTSVPMLGRKHT